MRRDACYRTATHNRQLRPTDTEVLFFFFPVWRLLGCVGPVPGCTSTCPKTKRHFVTLYPTDKGSKRGNERTMPLVQSYASTPRRDRTLGGTHTNTWQHTHTFGCTHAESGEEDRTRLRTDIAVVTHVAPLETHYRPSDMCVCHSEWV